MQINNCYGNTTTNWNQASSIQRKKNINTSNPLNENKHSFGNVTLNWGKGAVFAYATPGGNSFSIYKDVNPRNSSFVELMALNAYLVDRGALKSDIGFFPRENTDDFAKQNYMSFLQEWRDTQQKMGNWAGYKQFSDICNALNGFTK